MDNIDFKKYLPFIIIISGALGWILATGFQKAQYVRIIDVLLYGPYLIYLGLKTTYTFSVYEKILLVIFGTTTMSYNLHNFLGNI
jgi:hypothetical protein